jgi:LPS-assembly protein
MPVFMLRSGPFWTVITVLGSIMPAARAADPPCPSQITTPAAPFSAAPPSNANPQAGAAAANTTAQVATGGNISVTSDQSSYDVTTGNVTLKGNVEAHQGNRQLRANELEYDAHNGTLRTDGHVDYQDPLVNVSGNGGSYSAQAGADFRGAEFSLRQRAARGTAQEMSLTPQGVMQLKGVTFTTCPLRDRSWEIKANSIVLDTHDKIGTGRDARVDFHGVPIVYLPWLSFPLSDERKSGFLYPSIGNTSTNGFQFSAPYYWNIAPNADFTFEPTIYSKAGIDLGGDLRFLTANQRGDLNWNYLPDDREYGGSRSRVQLKDVAELPDYWRLTVNAENVSDPFYFEDFSQGPEGASTAFLERSAAFSYRDEHWQVDAAAQQYQTIDYTLAVDDRPYARAPWIGADADYTLGSGGLLHYGFVSEVVDFHAPGSTTLVSGWRADVTPALSLDLTGPGYFLRPAIGWRATQYELENTAPGQPGSPSRTLPIASVDTGLTFERPSGSRDQRRLTLEPRIFYLDVPYRNQDQLPVFDTALPDLNPVELFRTNRYVGADRMSDANQVSLGLTSRLLDAENGRQFIAATIGQTYYFQTPRVTLPGEAPLTSERSDFVAQMAVSAFQSWSADAAVQWNPQIQGSERTLVNLQYKPESNEVVNLAYRYERYTFDQVDVSAAWPIARNWSVFARAVYSLSDHEYTDEPSAVPPPPPGQTTVVTPALVGFLERFVGFEYRACCWRVRLGARRYVNNHTGGQTTGVWLQLELAGLASVGSASDTSLGQEIRGYAPPEATIKPQGPLKGIW